MPLADRARRRNADRRLRRTWCGPHVRPVADPPARPPPGSGRIGSNMDEGPRCPPPTAPVPRREPLRGITASSFARPLVNPAEVAWASSSSARLVPEIAGIEVTTDDRRYQTF